MHNTKRDKYDEVANKIIMDYFQADNYNYDQEGVIVLLKRAFPPPAEDARQCAKKVLQVYGLTIYGHFDEDDYQEVALQKAAAEIESFAQSRVAPWREALNWVTHLLCGQGKRGGAPESGEIEEATADARALLSDSTAKEAAK